MSSAARLRKCAKRIPLLAIKRKHSAWLIPWSPDLPADRCLIGKMRVRCFATAGRGQS